MSNRKRLFALGGSLLLGVAGVVHAETSTDAGLKAELAAMKARIAELESKQSDNWLNERRAEEVKALVRDVLSDADTRASLQGAGATAGYNRGFFLADEAGKFRLQVGGQVQFRYIANFRQDEDAADQGGIDQDNGITGFQLRRTKLEFKGFIGDPKINYEVILAADRDSEQVYLEDAKLSYQAMDGLTVEGGRYKIPFLREELTSSKRQLAVERSSFNEFFSAGRGEGVGFVYAADMFKASGMFSDGWNSGEFGGPGNDFQNDNVDYAVSGRLDVKLMGDWKQMEDFSAWKDEETALFVGAAVHWEDAETGSTGENDSFFAYTADASLEMAGLNIYGAFAGAHASDDDNKAVHDSRDHYGFLVQAGYMVIPDKLEPFVRYEYLDLENTPTDSEYINIITAGANYYIMKHSAKVTLDVVWALDPLVPVGGLRPAGSSSYNSTALGLLPDLASHDDYENQIVVRAQFQLLF